MKSLKEKAIKGVGWSFLDNISSSGITFLVGIILARLLSPSEFGVIGMITIFVAISNSIIDSGFSSALVRKKNIQPIDYNTVFIFNLVLSITLFILLFFLAIPISAFFSEPILVEVLRVISFVLIFNAFSIVQRTILVKELDFKTQTKVSFISSIVSGIVGVMMAIYGFGVWSLVGLQVSKQFISVTCLWVYNSWRPALEFSLESFKKLFGFGSKLLISGLIDVIYNNVYHVVIGKFYTVGQLGQYTRANQFTAFISGNLTSIVQKVSYPMLCELENDSNEVKIRETYKRIINLTMFVVFTLMLGFVAIAKPLILLLIGEKWLPSVVYLQILSFAAMLYPLNAINLNVLMVKGRSDLFLKLEIIKKIVGIIPIFIGIFYGIIPMLASGVVYSIVAFILNSGYAKKYINYGRWSQIKDIIPSFLVALCISLIIWSVTLLDFHFILILVLQVVLGLILTIFVHENLKLSSYLELKSLILSFKKKK